MTAYGELPISPHLVHGEAVAHERPLDITVGVGTVREAQLEIVAGGPNR